jgi:hypothetical protein
VVEGLRSRRAVLYLGALGNTLGGPLEWGFIGVGLVATAIVALVVTRKAKEKLAEVGIADRTP